MLRMRDISTTERSTRWSSSTRIGPGARSKVPTAAPPLTLPPACARTNRHSLSQIARQFINHCCSSSSSTYCGRFIQAAGLRRSIFSIARIAAVAVECERDDGVTDGWQAWLRRRIESQAEPLMASFACQKSARYRTREPTGNSGGRSSACTWITPPRAENIWPDIRNLDGAKNTTRQNHELSKRQFARGWLTGAGAGLASAEKIPCALPSRIATKSECHVDLPDAGVGLQVRTNPESKTRGRDVIGDSARAAHSSWRQCRDRRTKICGKDRKGCRRVR